jgi:hypothetical protein
MDLTFTIREDLNEEEAEFLSISGYVESRNQARLKDVDEPISLRQRLWLDGLREKEFANRVFDSLCAAIAQAARGLKRLESAPKALRSLTGWNWILNSS